MPRVAAKRFAVRRGPRRTRTRAVVRTVVGVGVLCGLVVVGWWLLRAPVFAVARLESGDYRYTDAAQLQTVLEQFLGRNIWTLDTADVAARVSALPWVRQASVTRQLPHSIEVDFLEWRPLLLIEDGGDQPAVFVEDGRVLPFPAHLVVPGLPTLVGVEPLREGETGPRRLPVAQTAQLLELVLAIEDAGLETVGAVDFVVVGTKGFSIVLQNGKGELLVGREEFRDRLERYMTARFRLASNTVYDLRFKDRITW